MWLFGGKPGEGVNWKIIILLCALVLIVSACAHQPTSTAHNLVGFWWGLLHGITIGFSMIGHLIDNSIRIYAFPNNGGWYDFGYVVGVSSWGVVGGVVRGIAA